jgi:drug/metabolite transporter (DMT)-like permease
LAIGVGAASFAAFGWGTAGIFADHVWAPGLVLTFYRTWLGAVLLTAAVMISGRRVTWQLLKVSLPGGLLLCGDMSFFFCSLKLTSVAVATVISALQPALVMLVAGPLFGDRILRTEIVWTGVAIVGVVAIAVGAGHVTAGERTGDLLALASLVCWSGYFVASKKAVKKVQSVEYTAGVVIIAAAGSTVAMLVLNYRPSQIRPGDWTWIVLLAIVPTGAHVLMNVALRHLDVSVTSVIGSANPIVAAVGAWIVLGQALAPVQIAGGAIGIAAIAVVARLRGSPAESPVE